MDVLDGLGPYEGQRGKRGRAGEHRPSRNAPSCAGRTAGPAPARVEAAHHVRHAGGGTKRGEGHRLRRARAVPPSTGWQSCTGSGSLYASLIAEQFAMADVPTAGPTAGRLASTPVGRMVKGMVDLAGGDLPRDEVMRWLTSCPVKSISSGFRPSRWDAISRDAGVVGGTEQWDERLARYARRQEQAANGQSDDIPEAKLLRIKQTAREAWSLRAFMLRLDDDLKHPSDGSKWRDFVEWIDSLMSRYMDTASLPRNRARKSGGRRNEHPGSWRASTTWRTVQRWMVVASR